MLKPKKLTFFTNRIAYLCNIIKLGRLEIANHIADVIPELNVSMTVTELSSFLLLCNIIR